MVFFFLDLSIWRFGDLCHHSSVDTYLSVWSIQVWFILPLFGSLCLCHASNYFFQFSENKVFTNCYSCDTKCGFIHVWQIDIFNKHFLCSDKKKGWLLFQLFILEKAMGVRPNRSNYLIFSKITYSIWKKNSTKIIYCQAFTKFIWVINLCFYVSSQFAFNYYSNYKQASTFMVTGRRFYSDFFCLCVALYNSCSGIWI